MLFYTLPKFWYTFKHTCCFHTIVNFYTNFHLNINDIFWHKLNSISNSLNVKHIRILLGETDDECQQEYAHLKGRIINILNKHNSTFREMLTVLVQENIFLKHFYTFI